jgi:hypothetical protein
LDLHGEKRKNDTHSSTTDKPLCLNREHPDLKKDSYKTQPAPLQPEHEISDPSGHRATVIPQGAG